MLQNEPCAAPASPAGGLRMSDQARPGAADAQPISGPATPPPAALARGAVPLLEQIPEGCGGHLVLDGTALPYLAAGEWAVIDPRDREPQHGGLFLAAWRASNGPEHLAIVELVGLSITRRRLPSWFSAAPGLIFRRDMAPPLHRLELLDGPRRRDSMKAALRGRVIGRLSDRGTSSDAGHCRKAAAAAAAACLVQSAHEDVMKSRVQPTTAEARLIALWQEFQDAIAYYTASQAHGPVRCTCRRKLPPDDCVTCVNAAFNAALQPLDAARDKIMAVEADTVRGLVIKARVAAWHVEGLDPADSDDVVVESLLIDLLRLGGDLPRADAGRVALSTTGEIVVDSMAA